MKNYFYISDIYVSDAVSYTKDPQTGNLKILDEIEERDSQTPIKRRSHKTNNSEQSHYYPFGLKHQEYSTFGFVSNPIQGVIIALVANNPFKYKYNGKEFQDELNLNWYDYGARNYDPALGRWMNMDPLAEKFSPISPYIYVANNPLAFYDPDGKDIYHLDKNTGDIMLVEENDDETDQIVNARKNRKTGEYEVRRNKKGEIRKSSIKVNNIEKGILKDEINFQENSYVIEVGDDGQPSKEGVEAFALELPNYVNKEIQGGNLSKIDEDNISYVFIGRYKNNKATKGSFGINLSAANRPDLKINENV